MYCGYSSIMTVGLKTHLTTQRILFYEQHILKAITYTTLHVIYNFFLYTHIYENKNKIVMKSWEMFQFLLKYAPVFYESHIHFS